MDSAYKWPVMRKAFPCHDVIMVPIWYYSTDYINTLWWSKRYPTKLIWRDDSPQWRTIVSVSKNIFNVHNNESATIPLLFRGYCGYGLSQWETTLHCNVVSHWLSPNPEWFLLFVGLTCAIVLQYIQYIIDDMMTCLWVASINAWISNYILEI